MVLVIDVFLFDAILEVFRTGLLRDWREKNRWWLIQR